MRILIKFGPNKKPIPMQMFQECTSYINTLLGHNNQWHGKGGFYSISSLSGGTRISNTDMVNFQEGGFISFSTDNMEILEKIVSELLKNKPAIFDMPFINFEHISEEFYDGWNYFLTLSPFKVYKDSKPITLNDENFVQEVKNSIIRKVNRINPKLDVSDLEVIIPELPTNKTKVFFMKNVKNHVNQCPVNIKTNKKVAELIYTHGIGSSTACGFGAIFKSENKKIYGREFKKNRNEKIAVSV